MSQKEQLNEMKQFMKISEGAWQLPRSKEDFDKLAELLGSELPNSEFQSKIYNILGSDSLFDKLDKLDPNGIGDAGHVTIEWMQAQRTDEYSDFPNIWNTFKLSQRDNSPMSEDPNDTDWDAHWAREDGDDERADDLEADAEFARMDDELSEDAGHSIRDILSGGELADLLADLDKQGDIVYGASYFDKLYNHFLDTHPDEIPVGSRTGRPDDVDAYVLDNLGRDYGEELDVMINKELRSRGHLFAEDEWDEDTEDDEHFSMKDPEVEEFEGRTVYVTDLYDGDIYGMLDSNRFMVSAPLDRGYGVGNISDDEIQIADLDSSLTPDDEDFLRRWYLDDALEEGGVKHDSYGATPVYEDDPDGMGSYDIIWQGEAWREAIPYDKAEEEVQRILQLIDDSALQAHDNNDHLQTKKTAKGDTMVWTVLDPIDGDHQEIRVEPSDMPAGYTGESIDETPVHEGMLKRKMEDDAYKMTREEFIAAYGNEFIEFWDNINENINLGDIVENVLQEYPGQPKDYVDDEDDATGPPELGEFEKDYIDPEIEDEELGLRFD